MALTLIATVGGVDSNSYNTLAEIQAYMGTKYYGSAFLILSETEQIQIAIECTRLIDAYFSFGGYITNTSPRQALEFPRIYLHERDGTAVDSQIIPVNVKNALCEQMLYFSTTNPISPVYNKYNSVKVGKGAVAVEYNQNLTYKTINSIVSAMLMYYGSPVRNATGGTLNTAIAERL